MAARADDLATTFRTWAATGEVALHRTAYLLTGDLATARLQVRDARMHSVDGRACLAQSIDLGRVLPHP